MNKIDARPLQGAYGEHVYQNNVIVITIKDTGDRGAFAWLTDIPAEARLSRSLSAVHLRAGGTKWRRCDIWVQHDQITLGVYPLPGDKLMIRW